MDKKTCFILGNVWFAVFALSNRYNYNNIEGKIITECWLLNEEGILFLILLVKRAKLVAHEWRSGCLATGYAMESRINISDVKIEQRFDDSMSSL